MCWVSVSLYNEDVFVGVSEFVYGRCLCLDQ